MNRTEYKSCCRCCEAAAERGELDHEVGNNCPHPPCGYCQPHLLVQSTEDTYGTSFCPACGDRIDYCQGHGPIGDQRGWIVLRQHDLGNHDSCHPNAGCHGYVFGRYVDGDES